MYIYIYIFLYIYIYILYVYRLAQKKLPKMVASKYLQKTKCVLN